MNEQEFIDVFISETKAKFDKKNYSFYLKHPEKGTFFIEYGIAYHMWTHNQKDIIIHEAKKILGEIHF